MAAFTLSQFDWQRLRLAPTECVHMVAAGIAWGAAFTGGMATLSLWTCGVLCPGEIALTASISVITGIFAIGPLAAYGRR